MTEGSCLLPATSPPEASGYERRDALHEIPYMKVLIGTDLKWCIYVSVL
jgi:hypothetical protein